MSWQRRLSGPLFAIPSAAPDIFGVTDAAFRALRRQELSPPGMRMTARVLR